MTRTPVSTNPSTRRLALVDDADAPIPLTTEPADDAISGDLYETTDTTLTFAGYYAKPAFDKTGRLQIVLTIDPDSPISNRDLAPLRSRLLAITLETRRRDRAGGSAPTSLVDPVRDANLTARVARMIERWVEGWDDTDLAPDWFDEGDVDE